MCQVQTRDQITGLFFCCQFCDLTVLVAIQRIDGPAEFVTSLLFPLAAAAPGDLIAVSPSLLRRPLAPCTRRRRSRPPTLRPGLLAPAGRLPFRLPAAAASGRSRLPPRPFPMLSSRTPSPASSAPRPPSRASPERPRPRGSSPPASGPAPSSRPSTPPSPPAAGSPPSRFPPVSVSFAPLPQGWYGGTFSPNDAYGSPACARSSSCCGSSTGTSRGRRPTRGC
jgi:hypothetical protein